MGALFFWTQTTSANTDTVSIPGLGTPDSLVNDRHETEISVRDTLLLTPGTGFVESDVEELALNLKDHSPHKATIYSAVLPGLGQIYNGKYWKVPLIYLVGYGFYSGFGYPWGWKYYNNIYKEYRQVYLEELAKGSEMDKLEKERAQRIFDAARDRREKIAIWMGILYFANVVDAMADAYFYYYDISDDLSLRITPSVSTTNQYVARQDFSYGFKIGLKF